MRGSLDQSQSSYEGVVFYTVIYYERMAPMSVGNVARGALIRNAAIPVRAQVALVLRVWRPCI